LQTRQVVTDLNPAALALSTACSRVAKGPNHCDVSGAFRSADALDLRAWWHSLRCTMTQSLENDMQIWKVLIEVFHLGVRAAFFYFDYLKEVPQGLTGCGRLKRTGDRQIVALDEPDQCQH
jgi:hypothetical protein